MKTNIIYKSIVRPEVWDFTVREPKFVPQIGEHVKLPVYSGNVKKINHEYVSDNLLDENSDVTHNIILLLD